MKKAVLLGFALFAAVTVAAVATPQETGKVQPQMLVQPLPASLDSLFRPGAGPPILLASMFGMSTSFSGLVGDFMEGDFANADRGYAAFRDQYRDVSKLVPEWSSLFPAAPMDAMGEALKTRNAAVFMPAVEKASMVCESCHIQNMGRVQQKYHWGNFSEIIVTDPISRTDVPWPVFMHMLDGDLSGVQVDAAQGQFDKAREHATGLAGRYQALRESCGACHDTERAYFVDPGVAGMIDRLGTSLTASTVDMNGVSSLVQGIGMESCHKCHLVHAPAALSRMAAEPPR